MTRMYNYCLPCIFLILSLRSATAQTTSWKGTSSTSWQTASNWTAGIPTSTTDAIIGDASFTGSFQPGVSGSSACKSLTLGGGARAVTLSMSRNLTIAGNLTINSNGTITDISGRIVRTKTITLNTGNNRVEIDISNQAKGLYLIQYVDEFGNRQVRQFVKQ